jgi:hypothetical protein
MKPAEYDARIKSAIVEVWFELEHNVIASTGENSVTPRLVTMDILRPPVQFTHDQLKYKPLGSNYQGSPEKSLKKSPKKGKARVE